MTAKNLAVCWTPTIIVAEEVKNNQRSAAAMLNEKYVIFREGN